MWIRIASRNFRLSDMLQTIISEYNSLGDGRYFDTASQTSFEVDQASQVGTGPLVDFTVVNANKPDKKASNPQQHPLESRNADLIRSLLKSFATATSEHFPSSSIGVYPIQADSAIAIVLVANKYSPQNFWNGRWRSTYLLDPSSNSINGNVKVDVHYYEDGNVRMSTSKKLELSGGSGNADSVIKEIVKAENKFQEELNRAFVTLSEGSFKGLRRQLPVTRQRIEWEKIGGYRVCTNLSSVRGNGYLNRMRANPSSSLARILEVDVRNEHCEWVQSWTLTLAYLFRVQTMNYRNT